MWKQFIDKWKQFFDSNEEEIFEEESKNEHIETPTYRSSEAKSKMTYHYPKTGSFRFPVIPDKSVTENATAKNVSKTTSKKETSGKKDRNEKPQPDYRKDQSRSQHKYSSEKRRPTPSEEPFVPTVVPSPIYGFQHQKTYKKSNEEPVPEQEDGLEEKEQSSFSEMEEKSIEQEENVIQYPFAYSPADEEKTEEAPGNPVEEQNLSENQEDPEPAPEQVIEEEEEPTALEEVLEEEIISSYEEEDSLSDVKEEKDTDVSSLREEKEQPTVENNQVEEKKEATSQTKAVEKNVPTQREKGSEKKSSVPFNVIMTPRDKRSRSRSRNTENTPAPSEEKDEPDPSGTSAVGEGKTEEQKHSVRTEYQLPLHLFNDRVVQEENEDHIIREQMEQLETTLQQFQVKAKVTDAMKGPAVTRFEVQPEPGVKVSKITKLSDDIKLGMAAKDIRMEAPIPGKQAVGIEVPNRKSQIVGLQEIFETDDFTKGASPLTVGLGLDIAGVPSVTDLKDMPHGLIAGATGSGKSVCINTILLSLLYKSHYEDVKFMLIDPKMVELAPYNGLPHLVSPVITDVKAAATALKWAVQEMEDRYEKFVEYGVRDVEKFNEKVKREGKPEEKLPYLVIVIDELADLMMTSPQDVEDAICKIAQKARACGIHMLVATQRPSVDVITGLIKANIPTRIAFSVSSQADSRTVLDSGGAEKLLGKGDMLFMGNGDRVPKRIQGAFVSDDEITRVTSHMKKIAPANYLFEQNDLLKQISSEENTDVLFDEAVEFVLTQNGASASLIQRRFRVGYNRAARLIDQMEQHGIISSQNGSKPRDVLWSEQKFEEWRHGETS